MTAMALPLILAACSTDEEILTVNNGNDLYPEVAKVDAAFDLGQFESRLTTEWGLEDGDKIGLAWLGTDETHGGNVVSIDGKAYQNHPLTANQNGTLVPQTSIYVGKYFTYSPYDAATQQVKEIDFSVEEQVLVVGNNTTKYNALAENSIWISPRLTNVTLEGDAVTKKNQAGVGNVFDIYPRQFSNIVGLDLEYINNAPSTGTPEIKEIKVTYLNGTNPVSVKKFSYAPTTDAKDEWGTERIADEFWAGFDLTETSPVALKDVETGAVVLTPANTYLATGNGYQFMYNALPAKEKITETTAVRFEIATTYGDITIEKDVTEVAYTLVEGENYMDYPDGVVVDAEDKELTDDEKVEFENSFMQKLYLTGKFVTEVDFYTAIMDGMHVANDAELQKILNYYYAYKLPSMGDKENDYSESNTGVTLNLDGTSKEFKLSKTSLALVQKINSEAVEEYGFEGQLIKLEACSSHVYPNESKNTEKVTLTEGAEVPNLNNVFGSSITTVYLAANTNWTIAENTEIFNQQGKKIAEGKNFGNVANVVNEGTLTVTEDLVDELESTVTIQNKYKMNINKEVNFMLDLINDGDINVAYNAAMFANGCEILNETGNIYNYGEIGVVANTNGSIINYGYIKNNEGAKTYISKNQSDGASFAQLNSEDNKMGTIELTTATDNISVKTKTNQGFIKYTWNGGSVYSTPADDVRYNYLIVKSSIKFTQPETEVEYIEVTGTNEVVITAHDNAHLVADEELFTTTSNRLKGFIVNGKANIKEGNQIYTNAAYISGRLYLGGNFKFGGLFNSYLGSWNPNNIIEQ